MVVMVPVDGDGPGRARAEEPQIFRRFGHFARHSGAANMPVQAEDPIGGRHHYVKVM